MIHIKIEGTGVGLPEKTMTNKDMEGFLDTSDEWIVNRTGISERRIVSGETLVDLSKKAAETALQRAGIGPEELDMIIGATLTPDDYLPNLSSSLQKVLGAKNAVCFDISAACSGFIFALNTARMYIQCQEAKKVLIVGGEVLSKVMDWTDRSTCILFGDGAGAAVIGESGAGGILAADMGADGAMGHALELSGRPIINPFCAEKGLIEKESYVRMDGQEVFKFAVSRVPKSISKVLEKAGKRVEDVDWFVLHQANMRIIKAAARRLKAPEDKFLMNLQCYGNTSAASVPIILNEGIETGRIKKGDLIVLSGFGGGLTWGSILIQM